MNVIVAFLAIAFIVILYLRLTNKSEPYDGPIAFSTRSSRREAEFSAPQLLKIIQDCVRLVNHTTNPNVFFSRYDLMLENLLELREIEHLVKLTGEPVDASIQRCISTRSYNTSLFIERSFDRLLSDISELKTPRGKLNRAAKYFSNFKEYSQYLDNGHVDLLEECNYKISEIVNP